MEVKAIERGKDWVIQFKHGCQYFTLDYNVETEEETDFMKEMLVKCFDSAFGKNWHENSGLTIPVVVGQSEQLLAFCKYLKLPGVDNMRDDKTKVVNFLKCQ